MESYQFLISIGFILAATKFMGLLSRRLNMPQVVGALFAGILLGPSCFKMITLTGDTGTILSAMSEIGVIILMFTAGIETDLKELKRNSLPAMVIAAIGVLIPIMGGFLVYISVFNISFSDSTAVLKAVFIGVVLSATSVSITVETLAELGKLKGKVGTTILGAAVIDDILGIIVLTLVSSLQDPKVNVITVLIKIVLYFLMIAGIFFVVHKTRKYWDRFDNTRRVAVLSVAFCLILSYVSEAIFGIADITGAYFAGLMLSSLKISTYVERKLDISSYMIFSPIFFASIGLKTTITGMTERVAFFSALLVVVAILTKVIGCGFGAKICGFKSKEALQIGVGMISRGEVALIVAGKGFEYGMLEENLFAPVVLVVIVTTMITPVLLKLVMRDSNLRLVETKMFQRIYN